MPAKKSVSVTRNRTAAIGLIVVCIVGTAILIAARSADTTSAATAAAKPPASPSATKAVAPAVRTNVVSAKVAAKPQGAEAKAAEPASIEGCLVQDDETFRLKDTAGEDAPKGRSWKSGFLHKGSKTIEVIDARHRLNLAKHVGERVTVSGMLDDRELQGTSLKRVAESCK